MPPALKESTMSSENTAVALLAAHSALLALVCVVGDSVCSVLSQHSLVLRAASDSATHGAVGVFSWAVVLTPGLSWAMWWQCVLCGLLACVIDVDHFLQAGSLQLKDAVSLQQRPPLHSTSLVLLVTSLMWVVSLVLNWPQLRKVALMCLVAWVTHHLRDANRRGLWFSPFGSTPPLPYTLYVVLTVGASVVAHFAFLFGFVRSTVYSVEAVPLSSVFVSS